MTKQIEAKDLFQVVQFDELSKAKKELDERKISMLIYFPDQLTEQLQANQPVEINYYINQSAPILVKRMMENLANSMNIEFNQQAKEINHVKLAKRIPKIVAAEAPNEEMAIKLERITSQMIEMIEKSTQFVPIKANVMKLNEQEGFVNNLLPLLIVLASYISAMLISQYLQLTNGVNIGVKILNNNGLKFPSFYG